MTALNTVKIEFLSHSANEAFARSCAACFAAQLDPTLEELGDLKTAVSEAVTNAVVHAYPDRIGPVAMKNIIGDRNGTAELTGLEEAYSLPNVKVHIYGKEQVKKGRKMGHITAMMRKRFSPRKTL